jgi:3',5'-cyclic AMP phosphodiesterase CpdA
MKSSVYVMTFLLLGIFFSGCQKDEEPWDPGLGTGAGMLKIAFISDIHYMAPELLVQDGSAFQAYQALDPKLLAESRDILTQLIKQLNTDKPDLLIIPGDLTKDGETISHEQVIELFKTQLSSKIKILALPGNHDIANPDALSFNGETTSPVPSVTEEEFVSMYQDFGYKDALSRDATTLSYVVQPYKNFRVIFIDATIRPNADDPNEPPLAGEISEETLDWIDAQMADAHTYPKMQVIAVMHHNLIDHWTGQSTIYPGYVVNNSDEAAARLYQAGLHLIFTGHSHANDVTKYADGDLYDIETGSAISYPLPYRFVKYWNNDSLEIATKYVRDIDLHGLPVEEYAYNFLNEGMTNMFTTLLKTLFSVNDPLATDVGEFEASAYIEYNAGDEVFTAEEQQDLSYYSNRLIVQGAPLAAATLNNTYTSWSTDLVPADNFILIDY